MQEKLIARPTFDRKSGKWNIIVKTEDGELKLGKNNKDGISFSYTEFDSKKDAVDYIENHEKLSLESYIENMLQKYGRMGG